MELGNRSQGYSITLEEQARRNASMPNSDQYGARCYGIWNIGKHESTYAGVTKMSPKIILCFELYGAGAPLFVFEASKGAQPWSAIIELTFSNSPTANLNKFLKAWHNNDPTICNQVDSGKIVMDSFLGKTATLGIVKKSTKKDPAILRLDVSTITAITPRTESDVPAQSYNPLTLFNCDKFDVNNPQFMETFFAIPFWVQKKVCLSEEVKSKGITFDAIKKQFPARYADNRVPANAPVQGTIPSPNASSTKTMTPKAAGATYDQFRANGWTDEAMIKEGYLIVVHSAVVQIAPPIQQAPPPMPIQAPQPVAQHQMTAKVAGATYDQFKVNGWTDEMLVSQGYMVMGGNQMPVPGSLPNTFMTGGSEDTSF